MKIVIDNNIPGVDDTFGRIGAVTAVDGRNPARSLLRDADALIVRSVTQVDAELLAGTAVRFVGTTTIGTDHLDIPWLNSQGITWASAPGCNADAASQYTLCMILLACRRSGMDTGRIRCGIVGRGNVGARLQKMLHRLGIETLACDPPLAERGIPNLVSMDEIAQCNVVTFHVPLTDGGIHPTRHLIDDRFLATLDQGSLLVNAARGDVAHGPALLDWLAGKNGSAALDVWPNEPQPDPALVDQCLVATPHVAGYSLDGKYTGATVIFQSLCAWAKRRPEGTHGDGLLTSGELDLPEHDELTDCLLAACDVEHDDSQMRRMALLAPVERAAEFDRLRSNYPPRRDFRGWRLPGTLRPALIESLVDLGFQRPARIAITPRNV